MQKQTKKKPLQTSKVTNLKLPVSRVTNKKRGIPQRMPLTVFEQLNVIT
jgi:hypothetical protein